MADGAIQNESPESPPAAQKKKKPRGRKRALWWRIVRGFLIALLVPVVLISAALIYLTTNAGKERVRGLIEARLQQRVNGTVHLESIDYELLGEVNLKGLTIKDEQDREVIGLDALRVSPAWGDTVWGTDAGEKMIAIDLLELKGLRLTIVKDAEGGSNLRTLFKKQESKPIEKTIEIRRIAISGVDVKVLSPDGTELAVSDIAIEGKARGVPASKDLELTLSTVSLGFGLKKPESAGGLSLGLKNVKTGLKVALVGGKGKADLDPLTADLSLLVPGKIDKGYPIGWAAISFEVGGEGDLGLTLDKLALGVASLASISVKGHLADGSPSGEQSADVIGLKVDATQVNALLNKQILKSDVDIDAHLTGTAAAPKVTLGVHTNSGDVKVDASLDLSDPANPKHDVKIDVTGVDTTNLLADEMKIPAIKVGALKLHAKGSGKDAGTIATSADLEVTGVVAKGINVDKVTAKVNVAGDLITIDALDVAAIDQHITASGTFARAKKEVDLTLHIAGDVGVALAKLKAAGIPIKTDLPANLVVLPESDLTVHAKGSLVPGSIIEVEAKAQKLSILGGNLKLDVKATLEKGDPAKPEEKAVKLVGFDGNIDLENVLLSSILAMRGKHIPPEYGFDAILSLHAHAKGTITDPLVDLNVYATTLRKDKGPRLALNVAGKVNREYALLDVSLRDAVIRSDELLRANAYLPLMLEGEKKGVDPARWLDVKLDLHRRELANLTKYAPPAVLKGRPIPSAGSAEIAARLYGSLSRPELNAHAFITAPLLDPAQPQLKQVVALNVKLDPATPERRTYELVTDLAVQLDEKAPSLLNGHVIASFPYSPLAGGAAGLSYQGRINIVPTNLDTLPNTPKLANLRAIGGKLGGIIDFSGNRQDVTAAVSLDATGLKPVAGAPGSLDAIVRLQLLPDTTAVNVTANLDGTELVTLTGTAGVAGKGLIPRLKDGLDPALDLELKIPSRDIGSLALLRPPPAAALAKAPGRLAGSIKLSGTAKNALAHGDIRVTNVQMMDGGEGGLGIKLDLDASHLEATIGVGKSVIAEAPLLLSATAPREALLGYIKKPDPLALLTTHELPLDVTITASKVDLKRLIPKQVMEGITVDPQGTLDWNMKAHIELSKGSDGVGKVKEGSLDGALALKGNVPIPSTKRIYQNVDLSVRAAGSEVTIDGLRLEESDAEVKDRWFLLTGALVLDKLKPKRVDVKLKSNKWLLFGTPAIGRPDAPRGALTIDAKAYAELDRAIKSATVNVDALEVTFPDRFDKAHQPEDFHVGDVVFLDQSGAEIGKLPVPENVKKAHEEAVALAAAAGATLLVAPPSDVPAVPAEETGFDIDIQIAPGARLFQSPIDLTTGGNIGIAIRPTGRKIRGKLVMSKGELSLGGAMHPLREGSLVFDDAHPQGWIDLWFEKRLSNVALRNISEASAGEELTIHTFGLISDRKTVLSGAGTPGALYDLLSMHNTGRERFYSEADLPESVSVEFPQHGGLLALSFISVNLPHLLFLDRVQAWSDPYDDYRSYGRMEHYEAERLFANGNGRIRAGKRPAGVGRSEAELEVDYLFFNDPRMLFGIGAVAGSRGGGGPALVFEWSSKD